MAAQKPAGSRLPEKWFRRGLWLIALVFASFLIGLGGKIIGDLPLAVETRTLEDYADRLGAQPLRAEKERLQTEAAKLADARDQAALELDKQQAQTAAEQQSLNNWLATRSVTEQSEQNPEVIERTRKLDRLKAQEQALQRRHDALRQALLDNGQQTVRAEGRLNELEQAAQKAKDADDRRTELQIFSYRLTLTLPLLLAAGWLFAKKRRSRWWPFVWGFIYFALFAFFVELVPYLPSYGGYVRYAVGILATVLIGRYAITAMNRYLERKRAEEAQPAAERGRTLDYDLAWQRIGKSICPGCERPLDFTHPEMDYCPHCSIRLFDRCTGCNNRKSVFYRYCFHCGAAAEQAEGAREHTAEH
ncbi:TPA: serine endopeptidase [Neisseria bacilliformis]